MDLPGRAGYKPDPGLHSFPAPFPLQPDDEEAFPVSGTS